MGLKAMIAALEPDIVGLRRKIHQNPELGWKEFITQKTIEEFLAERGVKTRRSVGTGLVADVKGQAALTAAKGRKRIALRADLDALPVTEATGLPFASQNPGVMHSCGHDMHSAILAGLAVVLNNMAADLPGDVRFLFQPAEEGGKAVGQKARNNDNPRRAAQRMIDEGALNEVDAVVGLHCWPDLPVGHIGIDPRIAMAGNAALRVRVVGKGGHGATPHLTADPVPATATLILALQTMASRKNNPSYPFVLTVGTIHGGTVSNVIPDSVEFAATLRSHTPGYLENEVAPIIQKMCHGVAEGLGCKAEVEFTPGLPPVVNDAKMVEALAVSARKTLGDSKVAILDVASMTSEDFAYMSQEVPGVYMKLGVRGEHGCAPLHNAGFNPDERAIAVGILSVAQFVIDYLLQ